MWYEFIQVCVIKVLKTLNDNENCIGGCSSSAERACLLTEVQSVKCPEWVLVLTVSKKVASHYNDLIMIIMIIINMNSHHAKCQKGKGKTWAELQNLILIRLVTPF